MIDIQKIQLGKCELFFLRDGEFWLDGGGYFGIVPKVIWQKLVEPDERNRVKLHINPMLIKTPDDLILIDPGLGDKYTEKQRKMYRIGNSPSIYESLAAIDLTPDDITMVVASHLHFDHIGACTSWKVEGERAEPVFKNAPHYFQKGEWQDAIHANERTKAAYLKHDFMPIYEAGLIKFIDGSCRINPYIRVEITGGHTKWHQIIFIESEGKTAVFWGGIVSAVTHLQIPYTMGFDLYPVEVMEKRRELYQRAIEGNWLVCLEHDPAVRAGYLSYVENKYVYTPYDSS